MSGPGASCGEMPELPFPGGEPDEPLLDMLLTGQPLPPDAPDLLHEVAGVLATLAGPASPGELAGEAAARSAFARVAASPARVSPAARPRARRRPAWPFTPVKARLAAALAAVAVGLGGGAAAYAGALPSPIQDLAHHLIGAPAPRHAPGGRQAAYRVCRAYERAAAHGGARARAAAFQKLDNAAGGAAKIDAYCAAAGRPGLGPADPPASDSKPQPAKTAKPESKPEAKSHGKPKGPGKPKSGKAKDHGKAKGPRQGERPRRGEGRQGQPPHGAPHWPRAN
jgi:hypothetical protein